jgi:hypothetical protein
MARTNANYPNLSVWVAGFEAIAGSNLTRIQFKISGFNVDRHNFAVIACFNLGSHLSFVDFIATACKFFFAISGLSNCHLPDLAATEPFHFILGDRASIVWV